MVHESFLNFSFLSFSLRFSSRSFSLGHSTPLTPRLSFLSTRERSCRLMPPSREKYPIHGTYAAHETDSRPARSDGTSRETDQSVSTLESVKRALRISTPRTVRSEKRRDRINRDL